MCIKSIFATHNAAIVDLIRNAALCVSELYCKCLHYIDVQPEL